MYRMIFELPLGTNYKVTDNDNNHQFLYVRTKATGNSRSESQKFPPA